MVIFHCGDCSQSLKDPALISLDRTVCFLAVHPPCPSGCHVLLIISISQWVRHLPTLQHRQSKLASYYNNCLQDPLCYLRTLTPYHNQGAQPPASVQACRRQPHWPSQRGWRLSPQCFPRLLNRVSSGLSHRTSLAHGFSGLARHIQSKPLLNICLPVCCGSSSILSSSKVAMFSTSFSGPS